MNQNVKLWLRAANPFMPPRGMVEAQRAARVGAVALGISVVQVLAAVPLMPARMAQVIKMMAQGTDIPAGNQAFTEAIIVAMTPMMMIGALAFSIFYLVLAVVQWRKMTWVIPAVMLAFVGYGLLSALGGFVMLGGGMAKLYSGVTVVRWIINLGIIAMYVAAFRGGRAFEKLKRAQ
ncbi:hypothetical protein D3C85_1153580 [compost metagenome]